jgi:hypothetical protein
MKKEKHLRKNSWGLDDNGGKRVLVGLIAFVITIILANIIAYYNK